MARSTALGGGRPICTSCGRTAAALAVILTRWATVTDRAPAISKLGRG
ncbi:hypothetical protein [Gryllotalpicola protaetiae]|nr:hypothetical protein [Gryllotalpicola protaetiae]